MFNESGFPILVTGGKDSTKVPMMMDTAPHRKAVRLQRGCVWRSCPPTMAQEMLITYRQGTVTSQRTFAGRGTGAITPAREYAPKTMAAPRPTVGRRSLTVINAGPEPSWADPGDERRLAAR